MAHLPDGLQKWQALNIANRTADLYNKHIVVTHRALDGLLYLIRNMRDYLYCIAEVIASAFLQDNVIVDLAGGEVIGLSGPAGCESLVVTKVKIGLRSIVSNKDLPMLKGRQCARVNINIRVEFLYGDI